MFSGQTKCVRYYMNFERALALAKECLLKVSVLLLFSFLLLKRLLLFFVLFLG